MASATTTTTDPSRDPTKRSSSEWKEVLTPLEYKVLRDGGTERPGSSPFITKSEKGRYLCKGCGAPLFASNTKYVDGSGWPSFTDALPGALTVTGSGMCAEIKCAACKGHL
eukprot:Sspe_Gene.106576::Locus_84643_Transcript_1_1_Confidence_1.000_Length_379::g.106576::m.106576/K07305/msrB; peptide-methionine (R)-S-oxide reductase